ncbi:cytochrome c peroxidase [Gemmatimonas groenlandica]|uniref:C-type cytochrome n=1 Tax=Gemmatimonas groenlandica TaxID=2732249 RepID=A0A6M4IPU4_9BACT|nr:cytochrome c peroxidase [Gemmatimonas groenlandica]QJR35988.1 c-type cytochrome [Gemmatimonas groenlandica]
MRHVRLIALLTASLAIGACAGDATTSPAAIDTPTVTPSTDAVSVVSPNSTQAAMVGVPFAYDATKAGTAFSDPRKSGLTYTVSFTPAVTGMTAANGTISGTASNPGVYTVTITARDNSGSSASHSFAIVVFAGDLTAPTLPATTHLYSDASNPLPRHFSQAAPNAGSPIGADNTPASNITTNAGATLGRVLFYDRRLSANDRVSCSSCHQQQFAFSDTSRLSHGFAGGFTGRHSMGLANSRFYASARFFWDERAASLEAQVLQPIQDATEMGMTLPNVIAKLSATTYYPALFSAAFGTSEITSDRVSLALSQFVRSLVSVNSKFDRAFGVNGVPNFAATFTAQELAGQDLFNGRAGCARCHGTNAHISDGVHNTGLDATITDAGAGNGRFKAPSLRNIAVRPPYMHDGRFQTLEQVIAFYDSGVQNNPGLDNRLRGGGGGNGPPLRLNLSAAERASLVAFLGTLTDNTFLTDVRFSNPFGR